MKGFDFNNNDRLNYKIRPIASDPLAVKHNFEGNLSLDFETPVVQ